MVDGDHIRRLLGAEDSRRDYTLEGRHKVAKRITEICSWLDGQEINVVCSTISLFEDIQALNRRRYSRYFEVYLSVSMETLRRRDNKNLYGPAFRGEIDNVVGVDLPFTPPKNPHMTIDNNVDNIDLQDLAADILGRALADDNGSMSIQG